MINQIKEFLSNKNYKELKKYCAYHYKNGITDIKMTENCEELWKKFMEER